MHIRRQNEVFTEHLEQRENWKNKERPITKLKMLPLHIRLLSRKLEILLFKTGVNSLPRQLNKFEFQGIVGNGNRSDIGLDDLNPVSGTCDVTPPAARVEIPSTSPIMPRTTMTSVTGSGTGTPKATEGAPCPTLTTSGQTVQPKTETTVTNVMRTDGQKGAEPLALALGVTGGIVAVILLVIVAWFITERRSSNKLEIEALHTNMENPTYDPDGLGGDIVLRDMEKSPVEIEPRYQSFAPVVHHDADEGFENPSYASMTSSDNTDI